MFIITSEHIIVVVVVVVPILGVSLVASSEYSGHGNYGVGAFQMGIFDQDLTHFQNNSMEDKRIETEMLLSSLIYRSSCLVPVSAGRTY